MAQPLRFSLLLSVAFLRIGSACSCLPHPEPFCARNLNGIGPERTVVFLGRVISAPGGARELMKQRNETAAKMAREAEALLHGQDSKKPPRSLDEIKGTLLDRYGSRMDEAQRARLRGATSLRELRTVASALNRLGRPVRFEILENLIGEVPRNFQIYTGMGGGDCGFDFEEGGAYLVEARRRPNGEWHSWLCETRVLDLESATEDLRTLRAWRAGKPLAPRIYGDASDWTRRQGQGVPENPPLPGLNLTLAGGKSGVDGATDAAGRFAFEDLEPGIYSLKVNEPRWRPARFFDAERPIDLRTKGCEVVSLRLEEEQGTVVGRVLPQPGEQLPDHLLIEAIAKDSEDSDWTDATVKPPEGKFEIDEIEPGDYYIAINVKHSPSGPHGPMAQYGHISPYGPTYYPGVTDPSKAALFRIERGQKITLGDWMLPPRLAERRLTGVAVLPNGSRAANARLILRRPDVTEAAERSGPAGRDGQFTVWPLERLAYLLEGAAYDPKRQIVYRGKLEISAEENGPLTLRLNATGERMTDHPQFFDAFDWGEAQK